MWTIKKTRERPKPLPRFFCFTGQAPRFRFRKSIHRLQKMARMLFPVTRIGPVRRQCKVELVHAERDRNIFGLPLLDITVPVHHADSSHHRAAGQIVYVMGGGQIGHALPPRFFGHRPGGLGGKTLSPQFRRQSISQVPGGAGAQCHVSCRRTVRAHRKTHARATDMCLDPGLRLLHVLQRKHGRKTGGLLLFQKSVHRPGILRREGAQQKPLCMQNRRLHWLSSPNATARSPVVQYRLMNCSRSTVTVPSMGSIRVKVSPS